MDLVRNSPSSVGKEERKKKGRDAGYKKKKKKEEKRITCCNELSSMEKKGREGQCESSERRKTPFQRSYAGKGAASRSEIKDGEKGKRVRSRILPGRSW